MWSGCTKAESVRLESLLNFACLTVLHRRKDSSATAARYELGLSTLGMYMFTLLYKSIHTYVWMYEYGSLLKGAVGLGGEGCSPLFIDS